MLSNTLRLIFCYLKTIRFLHPRYDPKMLGDILKNVQKTSASILMRLNVNDNEMRLKKKNTLSTLKFA